MPPQFLFTKALIEFISWELLHEEGSTEEIAVAALRAALASNMHIGACLSYQEAFMDSVDPDDVDRCSAVAIGTAAPSAASHGASGRST